MFIVNPDVRPKQLSMVISIEQARDMPPFTLPDGCEMRSYRAGDEDGWVDLINTGEFEGEWDRARFAEYITEPERTEGSRVVTMNGRIVAATFASVEEGSDDLGRVDFVVSHPDVRGLGLGRAVCTAVVDYLVERDFARVILYTDDWRLPAIGLYLSMGFEPQMSREDMPGRWAAVRETLDTQRRTR